MDEPQVEIPWMDGPMPVSEAVEAVAQASMEDSRELDTLQSEIEGDGVDPDESERGDVEELRADLDELGERVSHLESTSGVDCPSCEAADSVMKSGVAAAVFVRNGRLSENNVAALNEAPFVCVECMTAFAPHGDESAE